MTYVELDLEDSLFNELEKLAEEDGISVEELITDILRDEVDFSEMEREDDLDDSEEVTEELDDYSNDN